LANNALIPETHLEAIEVLCCILCAVLDSMLVSWGVELLKCGEFWVDVLTCFFASSSSASSTAASWSGAPDNPLRP
jgi:hypothetical protein